MAKRAKRLEEAREKKEQIINLYKAGNSICSINKKTGINRGHISLILEENGLYKKKKREDINSLFESEKDKLSPTILNLYNQKYTLKQIKKYLKENGERTFTEKTISKIIKSFGYTLRKPQDYIIKYDLDENAFDHYDKFSCYWAGFIAADGCIYKRDTNNIYLVFSLKDKESVEGLANYIKYSGPVTPRYVDDKTYWGIFCNNKKLCNDLITLFEITPKKTLTYEPSYMIPKDLIPYFILGYIDGDGSITYSTTSTGRKQFCLNITGTEETLDYIKIHLHKQNLKSMCRHPENNTNNYTLSIQGNEQLYKILSRLYSDEEIVKICMKRKYNRFLMLEKQIASKR